MNENQPPQSDEVDTSGICNSEDKADEALQLQLDKIMDRLAERYANQRSQPQAEHETLEVLKTFTRTLSDDELEWLAAAGPSSSSQITSPYKPVDPANPAKKIR